VFICDSYRVRVEVRVGDMVRLRLRVGVRVRDILRITIFNIPTSKILTPE
jgi:hypothetical protein